MKMQGKWSMDDMTMSYIRGMNPEALSIGAGFGKEFKYSYVLPRGRVTIPDEVIDQLFFGLSAKKQQVKQVTIPCIY